MSETTWQQAIRALRSSASARRVAKVYAEALLNSASARKQAVEVLEELEGLSQRSASDPDVGAFFLSGAIGRDRRAVALKNAFGNRVLPVLEDFLQVLNNHERLELLTLVATEYRDLYDQRAGRIRVLVKSAVPLPEDQLRRLRETLQANMKLEPVFDVRTDPDLLGGLVVRVGDWLYDSSVRSRLEQLRNHLIEASSHEIQSGRDRFSTAVGN